MRELRPVMDGLDPFLANFNPLVRWLDYQAPVVTDFLSNPSSSTADFLPFQSGQSSPLHLSRQMTIFTSESLSVYQSRINTNRGNGYLQPFAIGNPYSSAQGEIFPSHDCNNTLGGQQVLHVPSSGSAPAGGRRRGADQGPGDPGHHGNDAHRVGSIQLFPQHGRPARAAIAERAFLR